MKTLQSCLQTPDKDQWHRYCHRHLVGSSSINGNTFGQLQSPQALTPQENLSSPVWAKYYRFSWCYDSGYHWDGDGDGDHQGDIFIPPLLLHQGGNSSRLDGMLASLHKYKTIFETSFWLFLFIDVVWNHSEMRPVISTQAVVGPLGTGIGQNLSLYLYNW